MQRVRRHHPWSALWALLALATAAVLPFGSVANAAPQTICFTPEEGGPECGLDISAPQSVAAGQPFTVTVFLTDGNESPTFLPPKDPCSSRVVVTLTILISESNNPTYTANANKGVATFTVGGLAPGQYDVEATAEQTDGSCSYGEAFTFPTVVDVAAGQPVFPCPADVSCTQVTNNGAGGGSAATLFADEGSFTAAFIPFVADDYAACGITPADPIDPVLDFTYTGGDTKTIVFALSPDIVANGIGRYSVCWASNNAFTTLGGGQAVFNGDLGLYVGLLPNCSPHTPAPCVLFKTSTQHNGGFFGVSAPSTDPRGFVGGI